MQKESLLTAVELVVLNLDALGRVAQSEGTSSAEVIESLRGRKEGVIRKGQARQPPRAQAEEPDYFVVSTGELSQREKACEGTAVGRVLRHLAESLGRAGAGSMIAPGHQTPSGWGLGVPHQPAFVRSAIKASPLSPPPAPDAVPKEQLLSGLAEALTWAQPHARGFEIAVAKAARALEFPSLGFGIRAEGLQGDTLRIYFNALAIFLGSEIAKRVGASSAMYISGALIREMVSRAASLGDGTEAVAGFMPPAEALSHAEFGNLVASFRRIFPPSLASFACPADAEIEAAVATSLHMALEYRRHTQELDTLGLSRGQ